MPLEIHKFRARPRFKIKTNQSLEKVLETIEQEFENSKEDIAGIVKPVNIHFRVRHCKRKYWAPRLTINVEKEDGKTVIRGLFGPRPDIWTFFMFLYGFAFTILFVFLIFGMVEWSLLKPFYYLYFAIIGLALGGFTYLASHIGKQFSQEQLRILEDFTDRMFKDF